MNSRLKLGSVVVAVLFAGSDLHADTTVSLGSVSQFTSVADLGLDPANTIYAVNFSQNDPDLTVGGVTFLHDRQAIPGFSSVGPNNVTPIQLEGMEVVD